MIDNYMIGLKCIVQVTKDNKHDTMFRTVKMYQIITWRDVDEEGKAIPIHNVNRRYSEFEWLFLELLATYPECIIPPIPDKNVMTKINYEGKDFAYRRKEGLMFFIEELLHTEHLKHTPEVRAFLGNDQEFEKVKKRSKTWKN